MLGSLGITTDGTVNRAGIGAVVHFRPRRGTTAVRPVLGGSSYASQDALALTFGLGRERRGTVEVLWPGGVRNRLYDLRAGERVRLPEIPCSFDADWPSAQRYLRCVRRALRELRQAGAIGPQQRGRLFASAVRAYLEER